MNGAIFIGYAENGYGTGNYINIFSSGGFWVGKIYEKDGEKMRRGTKYYTDGTEYKYDEEV